MVTTTTTNRTTRILVWNVHGFPWAPWTSIRDFIDETDPDLVCLQEVWGQFGCAYLSYGWPTVKQATTRWWFPWFTGPTGLVFFARTGGWKHKVWRFGNIKQTTVDEKADFLIVKGAQVLTRNGLTLINTHLDAGGSLEDSTARGRQLDEIIRKVPKAGPLLILGDLNLRPTNRSHDYVLLNQLRTKLGIQYSFTGPQELDYILGRGVKLCTERLSGKSFGKSLSDHEPFLVTMS